jgi:hypothetical protein
MEFPPTWPIVENVLHTALRFAFIWLTLTIFRFRTKKYVTACLIFALILNFFPSRLAVFLGIADLTAALQLITEIALLRFLFQIPLFSSSILAVMGSIVHFLLVSAMLKLVSAAAHLPMAQFDRYPVYYSIYIVSAIALHFFLAWLLQHYRMGFTFIASGPEPVRRGIITNKLTYLVWIVMGTVVFFPTSPWERLPLFVTIFTVCLALMLLLSFKKEYSDND